ncbi:hypothetical protein A3I27_02100 [Candidatus Giovannonibacteria bacterium RIFCSPLOWO2_02_FULL_43_11b]|uniref:Bacterial spore germination immunoglobulin-like domain-containing protein n=1 Tax=Candidatus Giovannonibacteria bacterium RIFCSPHIGHO2_12_FULL_43_15 TaxID=1798341 RepID=A0A1F5WQB7_9BACT|nr:MAG: hypothetical protein A3B97_03195 [Candidatus Giovannonibacteria bacterium RIFCSPHIGHO2_02_FULL_43_32]OGF77777.1 MAG: hypothetical protein A3F23_04070 [Candidatus Giovannonibacteria bacterium RIFCSPHIGHO2_12_FULL_43_15]OGF90007.1 MAG: hypothetical protein A3I27_02100 [Candidatus Giovannonibacteria bacterium RIFCSPLOWO2_02_FULL_43_11b]OGF92053.1 MAG: hypothetical protein A3H04_04305 [Candidatus Giovannonibacteria bacterium RIFCSPLOWO2_12_FULL_43_11c]
MKNGIIIILVLIIFGGVGLYYWKNSVIHFEDFPAGLPTPSATPSPAIKKDDLIKLNSPKPNDIVLSPLVIEGEARGTWYFEASFPISLVDANGKLLARTPAEAQGEWMTENFVPFKAGLKFDTPTTDTGFLILEKDNPSGLPEHADELKIPVKFR